MGKYQEGNMVDAIYNDITTGNLFKDAMPEPLSYLNYMESVVYLPQKKELSNHTDLDEEFRLLTEFKNIFIPMDYMYDIYCLLYRMMMSSYTNMTTKNKLEKLSKLYNKFYVNQKEEYTNYSTQADCGAILGVSGIGKTSTIRRSLMTFPQVISHTEYDDVPNFCKQVLYLLVECPSDCSAKTLACNIMFALQTATGSDFSNIINPNRSTSALVTQAKVLCSTYNVGLLVIDEIQNAVVTAYNKRQVRPLIKLLVELTNDTCTSVLLCGTLAAESIFEKEEHLKRRTRGLRLLPMRFDEEYRRILSVLWEHQYISPINPLTEDIVRFIYNQTQGTPAYILKLLYETQTYLLSHIGEGITRKNLTEVIRLSSLSVPPNNFNGTSISDFHIQQNLRSRQPQKDTVNEVCEIKDASNTSSKRGRKPRARDKYDLLCWEKSDCLIKGLIENDMMEAFKC